MLRLFFNFPIGDNDGIPDQAHRCPDQRGMVRFRRCPDTDGDGIPDPDDKCPSEKGDPIYSGCAAPLPAAGEMAKGAEPVLEKLTGNRKSGLRLQAVAGGAFTMGSPANESGRSQDECQHRVTVNNFRIGVYEVTQADCRAVMGADPPGL